MLMMSSFHHAAITHHHPLIVATSTPLRRYASTKVLLVRNIGDAAARFVTHCNGPFAVSPAEAEIPAGGCVQMVCTFDPSTLGQHQGEAVVTCV